MAWVVTAAAGGAVVGGLFNYFGSQNAANAERDAANQASQTQLQIYNQERADQAPYRAEGAQALGELQNQMPNLERNFTMGDFVQDPGYQFQLQQGQNAIQEAAAARGLLNSTGTLKSLDKYSQGLANTDYQNAFNNYNANRQTNYNMLASAAGIGQTAVAGTNAAAQNAGNNISANQIGAGNAAAAGYVGGANAIGNTLGSLGNSAAMYGYLNSINPNGNPNLGLPGLNYTSPNLGSMGGYYSAYDSPASTPSMGNYSNGTFGISLD